MTTVVVCSKTSGCLTYWFKFFSHLKDYQNSDYTWKTTAFNRILKVKGQRVVGWKHSNRLIFPPDSSHPWEGYVLLNQVIVLLGYAHRPKAVKNQFLYISTSSNTLSLCNSLYFYLTSLVQTIISSVLHFCGGPLTSLPLNLVFFLSPYRI